MNTRTITTTTFQSLPNDIVTHRDTQTLAEMENGRTARDMAAAFAWAYSTCWWLHN